MTRASADDPRVCEFDVFSTQRSTKRVSADEPDTFDGLRVVCLRAFARMNRSTGSAHGSIQRFRASADVPARRRTVGPSLFSGRVCADGPWVKRPAAAEGLR